MIDYENVIKNFDMTSNLEMNNERPSNTKNYNAERRKRSLT